MKIYITSDEEYKLVIVVLQYVYNCVWADGQKQYKPRTSFDLRPRYLEVVNQRIVITTNKDNPHLTVEEFFKEN